MGTPAPPLTSRSSRSTALADAPGSERALHLMDVSMFWGPTGGVRRVLQTRHARLGLFGWRHSILAPGAHGPGFVDCGGLPMPGTGGYRWVLGRAHAERLIERALPDVVEAADPYTLAWATLGAAERLQIPAVAFCHSHLPALAARLVGGPRGLDTRAGRWAARRARDYLVGLYRHFDTVLAPSRGLADRLRAWGVPRVGVQPLGVDCRVFRPGAVDPAWRLALCRRLGLAPRTRLLVYSGRFAPEKNLQLLVDAVDRLGPGHALLCVGSGPQPPQGARVHRLPPHDSADLARLITCADAYVHAGDQETFGLGVLEAMACGVPVVASAAGGTGELVDGVGVTVDGRAPDDWADAIEHACTARGRALAPAALARAREHDWPWILAQMSQRYTALVTRGWQAALPGPAAGAARPTPPRLLDRR